MRATSTRKLVGATAAGLLIAATFFGTTAPVLAAVPTAEVHDEALPAQFTAGSNVGFRSAYTFTDGSSLSKAYLVFNTTGTAANVYVSAVRSGANATNDCTAGSPVTCVFKNVRTNETIVVTAAWSVASGAATVGADAVWSSSGSTSSDGGTSHGDTWTDAAATQSTLTTDSNYGGGFSAAAGSTVQNGQVVTALNRQATKVAGLPAGVLATVLDGSGAGGACGPYDCTNAIGEWSQVTVGDGQTFDSAFTIVITYYQGAPKSFVHQYVDGNGDTQYELVGACPKRNPSSGAPCFTWSSKLGQATIYTLHNGSFRGL